MFCGVGRPEEPAANNTANPANITADTSKTKDVLALPFVKNNDPYGYTGAFPNGALKAKTFGIEVANGKYTESFLIDTPDAIYTAKE